jgi:hypothetical protein
MKYLIIILLLFSSLFAWPAGTTHTMRVIVNSSRVSETATSFVHQLNLSDSIAKIDSLIDSTKNVAVCLPNGSTLKPKDIVYVKGEKFLIYWDGAKHTTTNDTFYLCFGKILNAVNSTATYSNSNEANRWGIDKFSGNTFYDYVGSNNGTGTSIDTIASKFGVGASFNASSDLLNVGLPSPLDSSASFTFNTVINFGNYTGTHNILRLYSTSSYNIQVQTVGSVLYTYIINGTYNEGHFTVSSAVSAGTNCLFTIVYDGSLVSNQRLKMYINGVSQSLTFDRSPPTRTFNFTNEVLTFGHTASSFIGTMDEIALMTVARSAGAILDRYRVLFEPSTFYTVGAITSVKKKSTGNNKNRISLDIGL